MLYNVNLNIVHLNTLTLCLSICNRMAPPTLHQMYPLLEVEHDDPILPPDDEVSKMAPPVQLQLRLVSLYLRLGAATPWGMTRHCRAVGYGMAEPRLWRDRTSVEPYSK